VIERIALWFNLGPVPLVQAFFGMTAARAAMAGARLGIYGALADRAETCEALARRLGTSASGLELLLESLRALGAVRSRGDRYELAPRARRWLDPRSPRYVGDFLAFNYTQWQWWGQLEEAVRTGRGPLIHDYPPDDPRWDEYIRAMFQLARLAAPEIDLRLRLPREARRIADLGGGHGWFSASLCRRRPELRATVVDLPGAVRAGRAILATTPYASRVQHIEGDARTAELGRDLDAVLIFQLLHHLTPDECRALLQRAASALKPGGKVAILEVFRDEGRTSASALLALHYFLVSSASAYRRDAVERWLREADLTQIRSARIRSLPLQTLIVGMRPG
jgi:SAM-dependent methyltransferase